MSWHLQDLAFQWARRAFGDDHCFDRKKRTLRLVEEAIELAQAEGVPEEQVRTCVEVVFSKDPGNPRHEAGGVAMTFAVYLQGTQQKYEDVLHVELDRVLSKSLEHFAKRNQQKIALGL